MSAALRALLLSARPFVADRAEGDTHYGFFPGGDFDPRDFAPDGENTPEELAAHAAAVEAWNRGERPTVKRSGRSEVVTLPAHPERTLRDGTVVPAVPESTGPALCCGSPYGCGAITYRDAEAVALLAKIDAALEGAAS